MTRTLKIGDRVIVQPETTAFDRPVWTIRETGKVLSIGRTRAKVQLDGSPDAIYTFKFGDLRIIEETENRPVRKADRMRQVEIGTLDHDGKPIGGGEVSEVWNDGPLEIVVSDSEIAERITVTIVVGDGYTDIAYPGKPVIRVESNYSRPRVSYVNGPYAPGT